MASRAPEPTRAFVRLVGLTKSFAGGAPAVDGVTLDIAEGESLTLLGPSGCGKSTTLRMIAGLERPDAGAIHIDGAPVVSVAEGIDLPPERRNIGMVFQSYAIWPHMTVAENVAFPLGARGVPKSEAQGRVRDALSTVGLAGLEDRPATRLSGGQQQRVALARALVHRPAVLLLDEPLSNLDVQLREQMRFELKRLQRRLGWTLVNVTHDQVEALGLSDRIAIMNRGRIEQVGTPRELYEWPATPFVRDFLGKSVNLGARIRGIAGGRAGVALACNPDSVVECALPAGSSFAAGDQVRISVRPEAISVGRAGGGVSGSGPVLEGTVSTVLYQGERSACEVKVGDEAILVYLSAGCTPQPGEPIAFAIDPGALRLWPAP